jgi:predicted glycogen debranching enzyme
MRELSEVDFGRSVCGDFAAGERREWLVTNGRGSFASGTVAGTLTRRYHGLLIAALRPPVQRTLLATKIDGTARYAGAEYALAANRWNGGYVAPQGWLLLERFYLDGGVPVWHFALGDALLEKRIWMEYDADTTYVRYRLLRASGNVELSLRCFVNYRSFHGNTHAGDWHMEVGAVSNGACVLAFDGSRPFWLTAANAVATIENVWYRDFVLAAETLRGLDDRDDNLSAVRFETTLQPGGEIVVTASEVRDASPSQSLERNAAREAGLMRAWEGSQASAGGAPPWIARCVLAADRFIVRRPLAADPQARSVIAGYPWFADWGRDTMISLPGLALVPGRPEIAKQILTTFSAFVDGGMLPNVFPDGGEAPAYNSVDAPLWYIEAAARYVEATGDADTLRALWPSLRAIVEHYRDGTRYGIHMDTDGLIAAGQTGVQLTWMDAKVGDWVVTPRIGKPVEIGALWYNGLERMRSLAAQAGDDPVFFATLSAATLSGFVRFWNEASGYCYDVIDGPDGNDASLRPNQIFAVSLPHSPLPPDRQRAVVAACAAKLLTSNGLRTLSPNDPRFIAHYGGDQKSRDGAYHQGTVWEWLLGPFAIAHARAFGDRDAARSFLEPLADQLVDCGLGSISEIADGSAPFTPRGAIAQAWSVAETLRAWHELI